MRATVYAKTEKGREEVDSRQYGLSARERRILILIDARKTVEDLASSSGLGDEVFALLSSLHAKGMIQTNDGSAVISAPNKSAISHQPAIAPKEVQTISVPFDSEALMLARQIMLDTAGEHLGLLGADIKRRIESAKDPEAISACVAKWNLAMRESRSGRHCVDNYLEQIRIILN